jgi:hypothetical protein
MKKMKLSEERDSDGHRRPVRLRTPRVRSSLGNRLLIFDFGVARNYAVPSNLHIGISKSPWPWKLG